jgi:hypothetical protein
LSDDATRRPNRTIARSTGAYGRRRAGRVWRTLVPGLVPVT